MRSILTDAQAIRILVMWVCGLAITALSVDMAWRGANIHHSAIIAAVFVGLKYFLDFKKAKADRAAKDKEDDPCSSCQP